MTFWMLLRERAGESQGGSLIQELMLTPLDFNGNPGEFQVSLDTRMDVEKRAPWQTRLASELLMALNAEKLQSMRAGPVKLAMQQMMGVAEREFTDGDDGVTHEQIIKRVHEELGAIHRGQVARRRLQTFRLGARNPNDQRAGPTLRTRWRRLNRSHRQEVGPVSDEEGED